MTTTIICLCIFAYLLGSIPFGLVLGKSAGIDVRQDGSGNIGATNVSRLVGKKIGAMTLLLDAAKGFLPMAWLKQLQQHLLIFVHFLSSHATLPSPTKVNQLTSKRLAMNLVLVMRWKAACSGRKIVFA